MMTIQVEHAVPRQDLALGVLRAENLSLQTPPPGFEELLAAELERRRSPLDTAEEAVRAAARDLLRNGSYKPTGRAKPASEYLLREAGAGEGGSFPRINGPVDACNYVSLRSLLPISLWDLDLAGTSAFRVRLGREGEAYVFNAGGQSIELRDLIVGCRINAEGDEPIVNPVKDSLATKTKESTRNVAALIYAPLHKVDLAAICAHFAELLSGCGPDARAAWGVVNPGETGEV
jgi:DNA/RNA-binding domain of Phe-tRNA-synthetase-like protein